MLDAEASGGTLDCTGTEGFVQDLVPTSVEMRKGILALNFDFAISTPLGLMQLHHMVNPFSLGLGDSLSADFWRGRLTVDLTPPPEGIIVHVGQFTAMKR